MLTKNVKTHYILIKEWDRNQIKKIPLTRAQYELYEQELSMKKHNEFFKIHDIDTQEIIFNGRANKVEWFEEIKIDKSLWEKRVVCSFGGRHSIVWFPDNCKCKDKFKCMWLQFQDKLRELGYSIDYSSDITPEMQQAYLNNL